MCTVLLPPGVNTTAVDKYIISNIREISLTKELHAVNVLMLLNCRNKGARCWFWRTERLTQCCMALKCCVWRCNFCTWITSSLGLKALPTWRKSWHMRTTKHAETRDVEIRMTQATRRCKQQQQRSASRVLMAVLMWYDTIWYIC